VTYLEIREQIFRALDLNPDITGDYVDAVNDAIMSVMDELAFDAKPIELYATAGPVTVTSATTSIALGVGGFAVTDLGEIDHVAVDLQQAAVADIQKWDELSYTTYLSMNSPELGDLRNRFRWVYQPDSTFILTEWPAGTEEWLVYLRYYRTPATLTDGGTPELGVNHHRALVFGAIQLFPQFFSGDRSALFAQYSQAYISAKNRLLNARRGARATRALRPAIREKPRGTVNWGNGE